jgi:hypothetical protein
MNDFATSSIQPPLRLPMSFGQILDRVYRLMRANLKLFTGIAAIPAGATLLIIALVLPVVLVPVITRQSNHVNPGAFLWVLIPAIFIAMVLNLAVFALYLAASIHAASQAHLGLTTGFREAYAVAWKRGKRYLWLLFLTYVIAFAPLLITEVVLVVPIGVLAMNKAMPPTVFFFACPLAMLLFLGTLVFGVIVALRLSLAFPASLAEDLPAWVAIRRSCRLTKGAKGRILLIFLVIYAVIYAAELVGMAVLTVVVSIGVFAAVELHIELASVAGVILAALAAICFLAFVFVLTALTWSAFSTAFAVLYHDQRLRMEGLPPTQAPAGELA